MKRVGVFIDGSNLLWASKANGWKMDFRRLREFLGEDCQYYYYSVADLKPSTKYYIGRANKQYTFHQKLEEMGYVVYVKPLKYINLPGGKIQTKGDVDLELAIGMINKLEEIDTFILFSGDSDYLVLLKWLYRRGKNIHVYAFNKSLAWEIREFARGNSGCEYTLLDGYKARLSLTP